MKYADAWARVVGGGESYSDQERAGVIAFVKPLFGVPQRPLPTDHAQGAIAEHLWYFLVSAPPTDAPIAVVHGPGFNATSPGGDGLVIYRGERPQFRLWEIKKHASAAHASRTVGVAYKQLQRSAEEYLAQYSVAGQQALDVGQARVYAELIERWVAADTRAGAGVAVATSRAPTRAFSTYRSQFPRFPEQHCRHGVMVGVDDLPQLTVLTRERLWIGL